MKSRSDYINKIHPRYSNYRDKRFLEHPEFFEHPIGLYGRPPVFTRQDSWRNVLINPESNQKDIKLLLSMLPEREKHKWFRSMNSSQALTLSVFGNLKTSNQLHYLSDLRDDDGNKVFVDGHISSKDLTLEYRVDYLGEPRPTSVDVFINMEYKVAIECKFTEIGLGECSRPKLSKTRPNYTRDFCNGTYTIQRNRGERCSLSEIGVEYWKYVPELFNWKNDRDLDPCPLNENYQLVRNVLAACVKDKTASYSNGHTILIYDERNPSFQNGGEGNRSYEETRSALLEPAVLRKCSWQKIIETMRSKNILPWLTDELELKYGL